MSNEIKSLKSPKPKAPALWSMFLDATDPPSFSYSRIVGFIVIITFMAMTAYLSLSTGVLVIPPKEWVYILVAFSLMKPVQRFAESKDNEAQLNYDFQMAQLSMGQIPTPIVVKEVEKKVDIVPPVS
jgi:hypothetical protein